MSYDMPTFISFVATSYTMANNSGDEIYSCCTTTYTSKSSDKYVPNFTICLFTLYRLITAVTNASGIPFFLIGNSKTFIGSL